MSNRVLASVAIVVAICAPAARARAQAPALELPRPSPSARITQTIGLTEVSIEYSCPGVKGRAIWGQVVPYGKLWRTGANAATKVTFSKDVTLADKPVPAGTYSLFTIPEKASWTVILNKNPAASTDEYKQADDLLRVTVKPAAAPMRERLAFLFSGFDDAGGTLDLEWEKLRVSLPIKVATEAQALASINALSNNSWRPYNNAARYLLESKKNPELAMQLVDKSLGLRENWYNTWTKAQLYWQKGEKKTAFQWAEKTRLLGDVSEDFFFRDEVAKALVDWKK